MIRARHAVLLVLANSACHPDSVPAPAPVESGDAGAPRLAGTAPVLAPALPAVETSAPWRAPQLTLKDIETDGAKGPRPALSIEAEGFPALSRDGKTFVFFEEQDYYGHVRDTSIGVLDVDTLRVRRMLVARGSENVGASEAGRFAPTSRKALQARLDKAHAELAKIAWTEAPLPDGHFTAPAGADASDGWELVAAAGALEVFARWTAQGEIERVRVQPGFEGAPIWSPALAPRCGYAPGPKHTPEQLLSVALVTPERVVLERAWRVGSHDCDGVPASSAFAFVKR